MIGHHIIWAPESGVEAASSSSDLDRRSQPLSLQDGVIDTVPRRSDYRIFGLKKILLKTHLVSVRSVKECRFNAYLAGFE